MSLTTEALVGAKAPSSYVQVGGVDADGNGQPLLVGSDGGISTSPPRGALTDRSGAITAGGTAQSLTIANTSRKYLFVQNVSVGDIWVNIGVTATADQPSIKIQSNGSLVYEGSYIPTGAVSIIGATTGQKFVAKEA